MKRTIKIIGAMTILAIVLILISIPYAAQGMELHVLDVGQGQAVFVSADDQNILIDGGGRDHSSYVVSYLKQHDVETIDYMIASHFDEDHIAGLIGCMYVYDCNHVIEPDYMADTDIYTSYLKAELEAQPEIIHPIMGDVYQTGDLKIQVVGPVDYSSEAENNRSVAVQLTYGDTNVFIGGDAEWEEENTIADSGFMRQVDVYIADHHGSASSSSDYMLEALQPTYTVISCGAGNSYGHPAEDAINRIRSVGSQLYRTDTQGEIIMYSDGREIVFNQEPTTDWSPGTVAEQQGVPIVVPMPADDASDVPMSEGIYYVGNANTKKFHYSYCKSVDQMSEKNKVYFTEESSDEIKALGFEACKNCNP